jgi:hypothetical protein
VATQVARLLFDLLCSRLLLLIMVVDNFRILLLLLLPVRPPLLRRPRFLLSVAI